MASDYSTNPNDENYVRNLATCGEAWATWYRVDPSYVGTYFIRNIVGETRAYHVRSGGKCTVDGMLHPKEDW